MHTSTRGKCRIPLWFMLLWALCAAPALAHGSSKAGLRVNHAYAFTNPASATEALVYFRSMRNDTAQAERLLGASTPLAASVELQRTLPQGGSNSTLPVTSIALPSASSTPMRHNQGEYRLLLKGLKQPLKDADRFELTLRFERAGTLNTTVWVQSFGAPEEHTH